MIVLRLTMDEAYQIQHAIRLLIDSYKKDAKEIPDWAKALNESIKIKIVEANQCKLHSVK